MSGFQHPGDPEVQQLRMAFAIHQDVGRFEIAVDDQVAVGV
ncbi:MAG TPA: hypothetical protein VMH81_22435 [Bryobacteraceae bacterium]|nr:hypothetical protein [Bryobacteraceae bacterium]